MAYDQGSSYQAPRRGYNMQTAQHPSHQQQYAQHDYAHDQQGYGSSYDTRYEQRGQYGDQRAHHQGAAGYGSYDHYAQGNSHGYGYGEQQRDGGYAQQGQYNYGAEQHGRSVNGHGQADPYAGYAQGGQHSRQGREEHAHAGSYAAAQGHQHYAQQSNGYPASAHNAAQTQQYQQSYSNGYGHDQHAQHSQTHDQRRYDPRYQQRSAGHDQQPPQQQQQYSNAQQASSRQYQQDPRQQQSPQQHHTNGAVQSKQSRQHLQPGSAVPKKMSMEEWKAQEKARMHKEAERPETLPQDNAFPTFPTKKAEGARGQSAMSNRSGDEHARPSTDSRRPGASRDNSYRRDNATDSARPSLDQKPESHTTSSARPSMDSQHRPFHQPERRGSPLNDRRESPSNASRPPPPRKDSYNSSSSVRSPPSTSSRPAVASIDTNRAQYGSSAQQSQASPSRDRPPTSDSHFRRFEQQPMSPLGKFAQSAQESNAKAPHYEDLNRRGEQPAQHRSQQSSISDVYGGYSDSNGHAATLSSASTVSGNKQMSRAEEIEAEMPDFDSAAPSQTSALHKRNQTMDQHLSNATHQTPPNVPAMPSKHYAGNAAGPEKFDFGFGGQQNPHAHHTADDYTSLISGPFANDSPGRSSLEGTRQTQLPYRDGASSTRPMPQRTYDYPYDARRPSLDRHGNVPAPWADAAMQRSGSAPPIRPDAQRAGYGIPVQNPSNPDALPAHPVPVRPGLMNGGAGIASPRPAPVRNYDGRATPQVAQQQQRQHLQPQSQQSSRPSSGETDAPITQAELQRLKAEVDASPTSNKLSLMYAKKLVEAAKVLASDGGRNDQKTTAKNRERYIMEAYKRVKKLSSAGYPDAQFYLADCHGQGLLGLDNDPKEAFKLYQSAAKAGHGTAAYRTAVCCEMGADDGGGTSRDYPRAVQWYKRAAALGETAAMFKVAMISKDGLLGQPRHLGEAEIWLKRAAERADRNNPHALHELGKLYETANSTPQLRQKIIPDDTYALQLYKRAADYGHKSSQFRMGQAYEYGNLGLPVDHRASISWYSKAAAQGEHQAELALSGWYLTGAPGILEPSDTEAYLWARKAARAEPPLAKAMFAMGYFLEMGIGCPVNIEEAKRWYGRAASYKHPKALERLEILRRGGKGGFKGPMVNGRLSRKDQKQDEAECVLM